jgi:hypothetical protein
VGGGAVNSNYSVKTASIGCFTVEAALLSFAFVRLRKPLSLESSFFLHNYFQGMMKNNLNAGAIIQSAETILSLAEGTDQAG